MTMKEKEILKQIEIKIWNIKQNDKKMKDKDNYKGNGNRNSLLKGKDNFLRGKENYKNRNTDRSKD